jgi:hypothetical protein
MMMMMTERIIIINSCGNYSLVNLLKKRKIVIPLTKFKCVAEGIIEGER